MSGRQRRRLAALAIAVTAGLAGCTGSSSPQPTPSSTPSSVSPSAARTTPAQRLQHLAMLGTKAVFHGTYLVRQRHPASHATWRVWRGPRSLRVDVVTKHVTSTLIRTSRATYSCRRSTHRRTCFRVAKGSDPIPTPFRLLAERLFSTDLIRLATRPRSYTVATPAPGSVHVRTSGGTCFRVTTPKSKKPHLESALYCLSSAGVITAVVYPSGNLVRSEKVVTKAPQRSAFHPYSSPTPLPG